MLIVKLVSVLGIDVPSISSGLSNPMHIFNFFLCLLLSSVLTKEPRLPDCSLCSSVGICMTTNYLLLQTKGHLHLDCGGLVKSLGYIFSFRV